MGSDAIEKPTGERLAALEQWKTDTERDLDGLAGDVSALRDQVTKLRVTVAVLSAGGSLVGGGVGAALVSLLGLG